MKIILMMAITADGKIAKSSDHFTNWTSKEDKQFFTAMSKEAGVVIMGENTFQTFSKPLSDRLNVVFTLEENPVPMPGVKWVSGEPEPVLAELQKMGFRSAILGGGQYLNTLFLKKDLIDEIVLTIEPQIFGAGLSLFGEEINVQLKLAEFKKINENSVMIKYKVLK